MENQDKIRYSPLKIGPYTLKWSTYKYRAPDGFTDKWSTDLRITGPDGTSMGCGPQNLAKLVEKLDEFWAEEF